MNIKEKIKNDKYACVRVVFERVSVNIKRYGSDEKLTLTISKNEPSHWEDSEFSVENARLLHQGLSKAVDLVADLEDHIIINDQNLDSIEFILEEYSSNVKL